MLPQRCSRTATIAVLVMFSAATTTVAHAQSTDELKQRIEELERSTREQVDALKRMLQQQEAERAKERRAQEERERTLRTLQEQVEQQQLSLQKQKEDVSQALAGLSNFFDLEAGAEQTNNGPPRFLGEDIPGNVYSGKDFKIRLGGSLRLHVQHNDTPVGESVSRALVPNTAAPGGGNNASREVFRAFVSRTRLNLAMQGPDTLGAKTSAFFEMDFNQQAAGNTEVNAVNNNPRLRWAIGRWAFPNFLVDGNELIWTFGQGDAFDQITPDTIDYNPLLAGLGDAERRNPRVEVVDKFPLTSNVKFLTSLGFERPLFDDQALGGTSTPTDCGSGCLNGFPAVSGGIGLEAGRLGGDFGIGTTRIYARATWGEFRERFNQGTLTENLAAQTNFTQHTFDNQTAAFSVTLDRIGFNQTGQALTLRLKGGGVWTRGEGRITNSEFDRRGVLGGGGAPGPAARLGGLTNPEVSPPGTLSPPWAGGERIWLHSNKAASTRTP